MNPSKPRFCIVGSGPGGFSSADVLLKAGYQVEIFESGIDTEGIKFPSLISSFQNIWKNGGASMSFGKDKIAFSEGMGVGGGSLVNSSISQRINKVKYLDWQEKFLKEVSYESFEKNYEQIEDKFNSSLEPVSPISSLFKDLFIKSDLKSIKLKRFIQKNAEKNIGYLENAYSLEQVNKNNVANVYKEDFSNNGGIIHAKSKITKVILDKETSRVKSIEINGEHERDDFDIFILSAGTTGTPEILNRSGLLKTQKLPFTLHPTLRLLLEFKNPINTDQYELPLYAFEGNGFRIGGSVFNLEVLGSFVSEDFENRKHLLRKKNNLMMLYIMIFSNNSNGSLKKKIYSNDLLPYYELTQEELNNLKEGLLVFSENCFASENVNSFFPAIDKTKNILNHESTKKLIKEKEFRKKMNLMSIHCMSSLPAGGSEVDENGRLRSLDNLYIFDASILPSCTETNPQGTIMNVSDLLTKKLINQIS